MTSQWHQSSCGPSKLMSTHVSPLDYTQLVSHHFSCSSSDELAGASQQLHRLRHNVDGQTKSCVAHSMAVPSALARDQLNCSPSFLLKTAKITSSFSSLRRKYSQGRQSKDANKNEKRENFSPICQSSHLDCRCRLAITRDTMNDVDTKCPATGYMTLTSSSSLVLKAPPTTGI